MELLAQVLCADAEPLLSAVACSPALLRALMTAPEAWPAAGGAPGHAPIGGPAAAGGASALATRWGRVVSAVLLRCGRKLVGWLEVQRTHDLAWSRDLYSRTSGGSRVASTCLGNAPFLTFWTRMGLPGLSKLLRADLSAGFMTLSHVCSVIGVASLGCQHKPMGGCPPWMGMRKPCPRVSCFQ